MAAALGWGARRVLARPRRPARAGAWSPRLVGIVLAFGAGALISAVSFDLVEEGVAARRPSGPWRSGLGVGALTYFGLDR